MKLTEKDITALVDLIDHMNGGDLSVISRDLMRIVYMLHFIPDDDFTRKEVQEASYALYEIAETFYRITGK